jgi:hypothetical protein
MSKYIFEDVVDDFFGKVPFGSTVQTPYLSKSTAVQTFHNVTKRLETDTETERKLIKALNSWVDFSTDETAEYLIKHQNVLNKAKDRYPKIFVVPSSIKYIYRGQQIGRKKIVRLINTNFDGTFNSLFDGFDKVNGKYSINNILYKPFRKVQSWTSTFLIAKTFAQTSIQENIPAVLCIKSTPHLDELFFNPTILNKEEREIIRFGGNTNIDYAFIDEKDIKKVLKHMNLKSTIFINNNEYQQYISFIK